MPQYDLVVIGSGPAGEKGAAQAAYFGKRVAIIESRDQPGGVCVHTGTLPSKTLRESSLYLSGVKSRGLYGVNYLIKHDVSVQDFMYRRHAVVRREVERIVRNCDRHRIDVISGRASFVDAHTIRVVRGKETQDVIADKVLIATGSTPFRPDYLPWNDAQVFDSDTILDIQAMPKSICIIGGGVIGCEYATIFAAMGIRVVLLDNRDTILPFLDREIAEVLRQEMMKLGVQLLMRESVKAVKRVDENQLSVEIETGEDFSVTSLLFAAGRNGNTQGLALDAVGIAVDKRGALTVNEHFQTSVPNVYAAGDVIGFPALASTSMEQARVAMCHAFELHYKERLAHQWPLGIYTIPEVSSVGLTEEECKSKGLPHAVGRAMFANNSRGQIMGEESGMLKLVFDTQTLKLHGVHIIGDRASELIHTGQCAMNLGGTLDYFIQNVFNYPTLSEAYKYAAYDGLGRLAKEVQRDGAKALPH
jgi:NAD(P) transhydrogenase